jgi:hypothetical protein
MSDGDLHREAMKVLAIAGSVLNLECDDLSSLFSLRPVSWL